MRALLSILLLVFASQARAQDDYFYVLNQTPDSAYTFMDSDAANYITRVEAHGVTVGYYQKKAIDEFIVGTKADGNWAKKYDHGLFIWNNLSANSEKLKGGVDIVWPVVKFNIQPGSQKGNDGYGDLGFAPTALTLNSTHLSLYVQNRVTTSSARDIGVQTTSNMMMITTFNGNLISDQYNASTGRVTAATALSKGYFTATRTSSTSLSAYRGSTLLGTQTSVNSTALATANFFIFSHNTGTGASTASTVELSYWSVGYGMSAADVAKDNSRVEILMDALGYGVQ